MMTLEPPGCVTPRSGGTLRLCVHVDQGEALGQHDRLMIRVGAATIYQNHDYHCSGVEIHTGGAKPGLG